MAALLISAETFTLSAPEEGRAAASLCELQPKRDSEPRGREPHTPYTTELYRTIGSLRYLRPAANPF